MSADVAERSLVRLAEQRGDVTQEVLARFYRAFPDARESFAYHGLGEKAALEGRMVGETAFLLLQWSENPAAAKIDHGTALVHHHDTLKVGPQWYLGMVDAFLTVLHETIPTAAVEERTHWEKLRDELAQFFGSIRHEFVLPDRDAPLPDKLDFGRFN